MNKTKASDLISLYLAEYEDYEDAIENLARDLNASIRKRGLDVGNTLILRDQIIESVRDLNLVVLEGLGK